MVPHDQMPLASCQFQDAFALTLPDEPVPGGRCDLFRLHVVNLHRAVVLKPFHVAADSRFYVAEARLADKYQMNAHCLFYRCLGATAAIRNSRFPFGPSMGDGIIPTTSNPSPAVNSSHCIAHLFVYAGVPNDPAALRGQLTACFELWFYECDKECFGFQKIEHRWDHQLERDERSIDGRLSEQARARVRQAGTECCFFQAGSHGGRFSV